MVRNCLLTILAHIVFLLGYYLQRHTQCYDERGEFGEHEREPGCTTVVYSAKTSSRGRRSRD